MTMTTTMLGRRIASLPSAPWRRAVPQERILSAIRTFSATSSSLKPALPSVTLYQYAICPFCNKVKAFLQYAQLPSPTYIEVNPLTKKELPEGDYRKVPVAMVTTPGNGSDDGKAQPVQVNGSDEIVQYLLKQDAIHQHLRANKWRDEPAMTWGAFRQDKSPWYTYAEEKLAILMYPNLCRTLGSSYQAFGYVNNVEEWSSMQKTLIRSTGSLAMYFAASRVKDKYGIIDERAELKQVINTWYRFALEDGKKDFNSGLSVPDLTDLTVFGTLRSVEGLPAHEEFVANGPIDAWYERMKKEVEKN